METTYKIGDRVIINPYVKKYQSMTFGFNDDMFKISLAPQVFTIRYIETEVKGYLEYKGINYTTVGYRLDIAPQWIWPFYALLPAYYKDRLPSFELFDYKFDTNPTQLNWFI